LSRRVLSLVKDKIDMNDARSVLYYKCSEIFHNVLSGSWPEDMVVDQDLVEKNLRAGEFLIVLSYIGFSQILYTARGHFPGSQWVIQELSDMYEKYDYDYAYVQKFMDNLNLLTNKRRMQEALVESEAGIHFISKTGFQTWLVWIYTFKARSQFMLGDVRGATDSLGHAEKVMSQVSVVPTNGGEFLACKFLLALHNLERSLERDDKEASAKQRSRAFRAGKASLETAGKAVFFKTESLKLMGVYYWLIGKQRKAIKWWRKAIAEGQRLNARLELSRTYYEVGKRLLEPKSKYKELDGIKAEEYLEKARVMFEEMDLQWDLDELEKLRLHMGT